MLPGAPPELTRLLTGSYWTQVAIEAPVQSRSLQPPQIRILPSARRAAAEYIRVAGRPGPAAIDPAPAGLNSSLVATPPPGRPLPVSPPANQTKPSRAA